MTERDKDYMFKFSYASAVSSLMYSMVNIKLDTTQIVGIVSKVISKFT